MIRLVNLLFATTSSFVPNKSSVLTNRIFSDTIKRPSTQNIKKMNLVSSEGAEMRQTELFWVFGYGSLIWKVWPYRKYAKCAPLNFFWTCQEAEAFCSQASSCFQPPPFQHTCSVSGGIKNWHRRFWQVRFIPSVCLFSFLQVDEEPYRDPQIIEEFPAILG